MFDWNTETGDVRMFGEVGQYFDGGLSLDAMANCLDDMNGRDITIKLKSDGGDVFEGIAIYNQLVDYGGRKTIVIESLAASIASVIAMAGDYIIMPKSSMLMIHNPWTIAIGDSSAFRGVADILDAIADNIADIYADRSKESAEYFIEAMKSDTYIKASEAVEIGLADEIRGSGERPKNQAKPVVSASAFPNRIAASLSLRRSQISRNN